MSKDGHTRLAEIASPTPIASFSTFRHEVLTKALNLGVLAPLIGITHNFGADRKKHPVLVGPIRADHFTPQELDWFKNVTKELNSITQ